MSLYSYSISKPPTLKKIILLYLFQLFLMCVYGEVADRLVMKHSLTWFWFSSLMETYVTLLFTLHQLLRASLRLQNTHFNCKAIKQVSDKAENQLLFSCIMIMFAIETYKHFLLGYFFGEINLCLVFFFFCLFVLCYFSHVLQGPVTFEKSNVQILTICLSVESIITGNPTLEVTVSFAKMVSDVESWKLRKCFVESNVCKENVLIWI